MADVGLWRDVSCASHFSPSLYTSNEAENVYVLILDTNSDYIYTTYLFKSQTSHDATRHLVISCLGIWRKQEAGLVSCKFCLKIAKIQKVRDETAYVIQKGRSLHVNIMYSVICAKIIHDPTTLTWEAYAHTAYVKWQNIMTRSFF